MNTALIFELIQILTTVGSGALGLDADTAAELQALETIIAKAAAEHKRLGGAALDPSIITFEEHV